MKLSVVVPVYNERPTINEVLDRILKVDLEKEVIVVDDGSTDGTTEILRKREKELAKLYVSPRNFGKGAAVRTGMQFARGDILIIQDADLEVAPEEYAHLIQPILEGKAEVVYGSRFMNGKRIKNLSLLQWAGNITLVALTNILYGARLSDMETCYKVFKAELVKGLSLECADFGFEAEVTAKLLKRGHSIWEVPISYTPRSAQEGKKIKWKDGYKAVYYLLKYRFQKNHSGAS